MEFSSKQYMKSLFSRITILKSLRIFNEIFCWFNFDLRSTVSKLYKKLQLWKILNCNKTVKNIFNFRHENFQKSRNFVWDFKNLSFEDSRDLINWETFFDFLNFSKQIKNFKGYCTFQKCQILNLFQSFRLEII